MNKNVNTHVFLVLSLCFCFLGREQEAGEVSMVEVVGGGGEGCFQFPPLCYQLLGSTSTGHGQLLPSWESSQCQAGRLTQQNGRHMTVALRLPALLRWLSEEGGSYLLIPLPSLGCLLPFSEKVEGWGGLSAAWDSPQQD